MREKESGRSPIVRVGGLLVFGIIALLIYFRFPDTRLFAQEPPVQLPKPLKHEITVTLKLIQVIVTDKKGNPVIDLKKEDFILTDNGRKMTLTEFEKHTLSLPAAEEKVEVRIAPTPVPAKPALLNRKIFLFFNFGYSSGRGIRQARDQALKFIDTILLPSDEVAVVTYSLFGRLEVCEFLTTDHAKIRKVVESIGLADATGTVEDPDIRDSRLNGAFDVRPAQSIAPPPEDVYALQQARMYVAYLASLAQALRYMPGQKILVLFTMGIDGRILYSNNYYGDQFAELRKGYENLCSELATSNVAVYPIDTTDKDRAEYTLPESMRGISSLRRMAQVTGGEFMGHVDESEAHFQKIQKLTGAYYVLGYPVSEIWDGKFHKIEVEINRPGCDVRAQAGYFSPRRFADYTELEKKMHLVDLALSPKPLSQLPIRISMTAFFCSGGTADNLCSVAEIPVEKIREISKGKAEAVSLVFNAADDIVSMSRSEQNFADLTERSAYLVTLHSVPPGRAYKCRTVVRDLETGRAAVAAAQSVFIAPNQGIQLYPPLFFVPERGARYIRAEAVKSGKRESDVALSRVFPLDSAQYAPLVEKRVRRNSEIWAGIRCRAAGPASKIKLSAFLVDKITAEQIPIPLDIVTENLDGDESAFFIRLRIPAVEPDEYRFVLGAKDTASGAASQLGCDFVIDEEES